MSTKGVLARSPKVDLDKKNVFIAQWRGTQPKLTDVNLHLLKRTTDTARVTGIR